MVEKSVFLLLSEICGLKSFSLSIYIKLMGFTRQFYMVFLYAMLFFLLLCIKILTFKIQTQ